MNPILEAIRDRRSVRRYKPEMVPQAAIDEVIRAGLWAASGRGLQAPIVVAVTNRDLRDRLSAMNCQIGGWQPDFDPFYGAPVLLSCWRPKVWPPASMTPLWSWATCCWPPTRWGWAPAGSIGPGKNSPPRKAGPFCGSSASAAITRALATAFWAMPTWRPPRERPGRTAGSFTPDSLDSDAREAHCKITVICREPYPEVQEQKPADTGDQSVCLQGGWAGRSRVPPAPDPALFLRPRTTANFLSGKIRLPATGPFAASP